MFTRPSLLVVFLISSFFLNSCEKEPNTLFQLLSPEETGITFANRIFESDTLNILNQEYIYNGGGVAVGDFNNDGLSDIYFTGNMVPNKLYLNKGNFKFEDISQKAKVTGGGKWSSGVALADINNDGWLDMYVTATMKKNAASRANLLYINNGTGKDGVPTFTESAAAYGLADTGYSTNAAFLDYDKDGDLDLYVLTNTITNGLPTSYRKQINNGTAENNDRLYRNNGNNTFTNITQEAGILYEGYGLGVAINDINLDGWPDIYVTNDYLSNDLLYINNKNGTFSNKITDYIKHTSFSAMGNSVTDINNDGLVDIMAVDMLPEDNKRKKMMVKSNNYVTYFNNNIYGYQHQYARNTLQLNNGISPKGHPVFSEVGQLTGLYQTDWSWTPLVADFDNDGLRDVIITNGFPRDITDHDFAVYNAGMNMVANEMSLVDSIPQIKLPNYVFKNNGSLQFTDKTRDWGLSKPSFSNGAAYADLDNDGDLDFVVNNINDSAFVYQNTLYTAKTKEKSNNYLRVKFAGAAPNTAGLGAKVKVFLAGGQEQYYEHSIYSGYLSTVEQAAHFGLGQHKVVDSIKVTWPDGKQQVLKQVKANQVLTLNQKNAAGNGVYPDASTMFVNAPLKEASGLYNILFKHQEDDKIDFNIQKTLPHKYTQYGPGIAVGDIDNNGLDDFYIGGAAGKKGTFFLQQENGKFKSSTQNMQLTGTKTQEELGVLFFDADNDNDLDLYAVSGSYEFQEGTPNLQDKLYKNNGKGIFQLDEQALPAFQSSKSCVKAADYDQDGDLDLFVGGRVVSGKYPLAPASYLLQNNGGKFIDVTAQVCPELSKFGMITDALWSDFDNDGKVDLVLAGEWLPVSFFKNTGRNLKNITTASGIAEQTGWWNSLVAGDFDQDGDTDYLAGNLGLNTNYTASKDKPLRVYAKDFDNNGSIDPVLACYMKAEDGTFKPFPMHTRDDLNAQMPRTRSVFARYVQYSQAPIDEVLKPKDLEKALILEAVQMGSSYIQNLGGGKFKMSLLPRQAQIAPVYGMQTADVNQDGNLDVLLVGNDYGTEVFTGRYDAFTGLYLQGNGKGNFIPRSIQHSGFMVNGDAKGLATLYGRKGEKIVIATQNQDSLKVYNIKNTVSPGTKQPAQLIALQPVDAWAVVTYANGKKEKLEFNYGSTYLSQSARRFERLPTMTSVEIFDFKGRSRKL
ncbi:hypothetical protein AAE02nite_30110 [Adhaeribacter aerolatus]|uniref:ASPIC/UnbV domain-containing protein n=1 Tax=Adhaeribacter aerolatus TaxID=670289 RepID=A0A512B0N0_9BACT|nr:VCBS repeat-containing protein [Adhaeribacter aerolatus]GEO05347.1 hypothetical protein AAE02nite_30110 [Adhaeribacter aerolatus]